MAKVKPDAWWKSYRAQMLSDLAEILDPIDLGLHIDALPSVFLSFRPRALKIGIFDDLLAAEPWIERSGGERKERLKAWFARWCSSTAYLERIAEGTNRHDLGGRNCELITDMQRAYARGRLAKRAKIKQACRQKLAA